MSKRVLLAVLALALLVVGAALYMTTTSATPQLAEDCADEPKPKEEFAMAAECDDPGAAAASPGHTPDP